MASIETEKLTKVYRGKKTPALQELDLKVDGGELFGFLGPNGAGKTTTIRILVTLLRPTKGRASVAGHDVSQEPAEAMQSVGFMPENPGFYSTLSGRQHLDYWAKLYGLNRESLKDKINMLLKRVGLSDAADRKAKTYSLGMKRRLALAGSLISDPELLILDEPSLGLDPEGMVFVRSLLKELQEEGRTIFLSSHLLSEVEKLCTRVGIISHGRLLRVDTPRALTQILGGTGRVLEVETRGVDSAILEKLKSIEGISRLEMQGNLLRVYGQLGDETVAEVNKQLATAGVAILSSRRLEPNLEDAFLDLTREKT
ncbi:MAG TPA: ABC transporter ATP-binding protein [Candidatus Bathyarchaeia archaeon]|nr:ABC transporter ATP-binding protein [Candidatus Bathyarchaeia archaeon]